MKAAAWNLRDIKLKSIHQKKRQCCLVYNIKNQTKYRETLSLIGHFLPFPRIFDPRKPDIGKLLSCLPDAVDDSLPTYHLSTAPVYQCTSAVYLCALKRNNLLVSYTTPRCAWPSVNFSLHFMSGENLLNALIRSTAGTRHLLKGISLQFNPIQSNINASTYYILHIIMHLHVYMLFSQWFMFNLFALQ